MSRRVLPVDDSDAAADVLHLYLSGCGHDVRTTTSGAEALETASRFDPDVVILDIGSRNLDGEDVAKRIRAMPGGADKWSLAVMGLDRGDRNQRRQKSEFNRHIIKPVGRPVPGQPDHAAATRINRGFEYGTLKKTDAFGKRSADPASAAVCVSAVASRPDTAPCRSPT